MHVPVCVCVFMCVRVFVCVMSVCLSVCPPVCLSACLSVCLSVRSVWVSLLVCKLVRACVVIARVGLKLVPLNIRVCMALAG